MLLSLAVAAVLAAPQPIKVAAPGLQISDVPAARAEVLSDFYAQKLSEAGHGRLTVITRSQISALLGYERQKELLGCNTNSSSCMAELTNALGADVILTGTLGRIGSAFAINLKLVNAATGRELSARSGTVKEETALLDWLAQAARGMAPEVIRALRPDEVTTAGAEVTAPVSEETQTSARSRAWIPAVGGVALAGGGAVFLVLAASDAQKLRDPRPDYVADDLVTSGKRNQIVGDALVAGGIAALATAGLMYALGGPSEEATTPQAVLVPSPTGGALVLSGRFP